MQWLLIWLLTINGSAWFLTVLDKSRARKGGRRVPEATLLTVAALGGAFAMLLTMRHVRHKTRHRRFMWGLPAMLSVQLLLLLFFLYFFCERWL